MEVDAKSDEKMQLSDHDNENGKENYRYIAFYGITLPKKIQTINKDLQEHFEGIPSYLSSQKQKYEFQLLYLFPTSNNSKLVLRKRRICIGNKEVKDALDGEECNILTKKSMQTKGKKIILESDGFDYDSYVQSGGFLDKRFWVYNLLWNNQDLFENYQRVVKRINEDVRLKYLDISKLNKTNKITAKKLKGIKKVCV